MVLYDKKMSLGIKIKQARINTGLTQEKLARLLDVTTQTIYKIEKDKNIPYFTLVKKISEALNIKLDSL